VAARDVIGLKEEHSVPDEPVRENHDMVCAVIALISWLCHDLIDQSRNDLVSAQRRTAIVILTQAAGVEREAEERRNYEKGGVNGVVHAPWVGSQLLVQKQFWTQALRQKAPSRP
jgi:hypothetical protein